MKNFIHEVQSLIPYTRPNSFISYLDNIFACVLFIFLRKISSLSPNKLTSISFFLWIAALFSVLKFESNLFFIFFGFLSYTFDNLDGIWARYFHRSSNFGAWFDCTCDRIKDLLILSTFVLMFQGTPIFFFSIVALVLYGITLIFDSRLDKYFKQKHVSIPVQEEQKKKRFLAFGPAEALCLYSCVFLFPLAYKSIPLLIFSFFMIFVLVQTKKNYEFFE